MTTSSLPLIAKQFAVSHDENTVLIELICADAYAAAVLYDDVLSRVSSDAGLTLSVKCKPVAEGSTS